MAARPHGEGNGPAAPVPAPPPGDAPAGAGGKLTRAGGAWIAVVVFAVVLLLLLIFILENRREVDIAYFGAHTRMPLGVARLRSVLGALLVAIPAGARIMQQRRAARRQSRAAAKSANRTQTSLAETPQEPAG